MFRCPDSGAKRRLSFPSKARAEDHRAQLVAQVMSERYFNPNANPIVAEVVEHWGAVKRGTVKRQTMRGYRLLLKIIVGPLLRGSPQERVYYSLTGEKPRRGT